MHYVALSKCRPECKGKWVDMICYEMAARAGERAGIAFGIRQLASGRGFWILGIRIGHSSLSFFLPPLMWLLLLGWADRRLGCMTEETNCLLHMESTNSLLGFLLPLWEVFSRPVGVFGMDGWMFGWGNGWMDGWIGWIGCVGWRTLRRVEGSFSDLPNTYGTETSSCETPNVLLWTRSAGNKAETETWGARVRVRE